LVISQNILTNEKKVLREIVQVGHEFARQSIQFETNGYYQVILTASLNVTANMFVVPYLAIDDINFTPACTLVNQVPTNVTLPNGGKITTVKPNSCPTISCVTTNSTQICLNANQICDFITDCRDGSDEKNCGDCDFDHGDMCAWQKLQS